VLPRLRFWWRLGALRLRRAVAGHLVGRPAAVVLREEAGRLRRADGRGAPDRGGRRPRGPRRRRPGARGPAEVPQRPPAVPGGMADLRHRRGVLLRGAEGLPGGVHGPLRLAVVQPAVLHRTRAGMVGGSGRAETPPGVLKASFNCSFDLETQRSWSASKSDWCCSNFRLGCPPSATGFAVAAAGAGAVNASAAVPSVADAGAVNVSVGVPSVADAGAVNASVGVLGVADAGAVKASVGVPGVADAGAVNASIGVPGVADADAVNASVGVPGVANASAVNASAGVPGVAGVGNASVENLTGVTGEFGSGVGTTTTSSTATTSATSVSTSVTSTISATLTTWSITTLTSYTTSTTTLP
ncbi:unnamed protein product, partial [Prorocentrum cordatum]